MFYYFHKCTRSRSGLTTHGCYTSYKGLIPCARPNINCLINNITQYILYTPETWVIIVQRRCIGFRRYGVLHSSPLRHIRPRMLVTSAYVHPALNTCGYFLVIVPTPYLELSPPFAIVKGTLTSLVLWLPM